MKQSAVLLLSLLCSAALAAWPGHTGKPFPSAAFDDEWVPIDSPVTQPHRAQQACCWDPVHDMIYMYGGAPSRSNGVLDLCQRYDPARDTWFDMTPMTSPRRCIKGLYCRGRLYAIGGQPATTSCEAYDIQSNTWSSIAPLPCSLWSYQAAVWRDSLIYVMGGNRDTFFSDSVLVYSPFTNTWTRATPMLAAAGEGDACIIGDTIYFAGAQTWSGSELNCDSTLRIGAIDPAAPERIDWSWGPAIGGPGEKRCDGPTVALGGRVYYFAGLYNADVSNYSFCYDPATGKVTRIPDYGGLTAFCCFGVARESLAELYGLAGDQTIRSVPQYQRLCPPGFYDVGVTQIITPSAGVDSGDTFIPAAMIGNFGRHPEGFRVRMEIAASYSDFESTYVLPGETVKVSFAPWIADCRGSQVLKCSTMFAEDNQHGNDVMFDSIEVHYFEAGVTGLYLPDSMPAGDFSPVVMVMNYDAVPGAVWVEWRILQDDTLSVYARRESTYLTSEGSQYVSFPTWNATPGSYLAKVFATHRGVVMRDTIIQHFRVVPTGIEESDNEPLPLVFALDIASSNPSRGAVTIRYALPKTADISLKLYDATGKLRAVLNQGRKSAGWYSATFDIRDSRFDIAPGLYFVRLESPSFVRTRKVVITQ